MVLCEMVERKTAIEIGYVASAGRRPIEFIPALSLQIKNATQTAQYKSAEHV